MKYLIRCVNQPAPTARALPACLKAGGGVNAAQRSDGQSQILGQVVITSIGNIDPWQRVFELPENWDPSDQIQRSGKTWIWIHDFPYSYVAIIITEFTHKRTVGMRWSGKRSA